MGRICPIWSRETVNFLLNQSNPATAGTRITARQSEILQLLAEGMPMKEVANELNLEPETIAFHKYRMMETVGLKTNAELLEFAIKRQMLSR